MSKRSKGIILIACGILALVLLWQVIRDREPSYQGRSLSGWVELVGPAYLWKDSDDEVKAVRAIGTNAIRTILKWISYEPSASRKKITELAEHLPGSHTSDPIAPISLAEERADHAVTVFRILGPEARPAIPELTRLMLTSSDDRRAHRCFAALIQLGPEAVPSLCILLTNRWPELRLPTIFTLTVFGTNAQVALPALRPLLTDSDYEVRKATTNALFRIAPEVFTKAPPP